MSLIIKILFAALIFLIVGSATFLSIKNVSITQETVTKEISVKELIK